MKEYRYVALVRKLRKSLREYRLHYCILELSRNKPGLLPYQYNYLYSLIVNDMIARLFRVQSEVVLSYDAYFDFIKLPKYYEQPDKPLCIKCKYNIENINEKNIFENEK